MSKKIKKKVKSNTKKRINIASLIIFSLFFIILLMLTINIFKLNMLPFKIIFFILTIGIIIAAIFGILLLNKKIKWKIKIVCNVILVILSVGLFIVNHYIDRTISFFKTVTGENYEVENYYVLTLKESELDNEKDLLDKKIAFVENLGTSNKALEKLKEVVAFETIKKNSILELANSLLDSDVDAVLIADYHKSILDEEIEDFSSSVKIIYSFSIKKETVVKSTTVDLTKDSFNIYLSGIDTYGTIDTVARSDVNMVVTVNPVTKQVLLTSIPRDYYVNLSCANQMDKLTHAGMYGIDCSIGTVEELLNININYYVRVNFSSLINIVDVLDGINVYSEYAFGIDKYYFQQGYNYLYGEAALMFSRERHSFIDGDRQRGKNQQAVIAAIVNKAISPAILSKYTGILEALKDSFQTNMGMSDIQTLAKFQIDKMPKWNISSISVNGSDSENYTYSYGDQLLYVMTPDVSTVNYANETINKVMKGQNIDLSAMPTSDNSGVSLANAIVDQVTTVPKETTTTSTTVTTTVQSTTTTTTTVQSTTTTTPKTEENPEETVIKDDIVENNSEETGE